jgi:hypothetical protein
MLFFLQIRSVIQTVRHQTVKTQALAVRRAPSIPAAPTSFNGVEVFPLLQWNCSRSHSQHNERAIQAEFDGQYVRRSTPPSRLSTSRPVKRTTMLRPHTSHTQAKVSTFGRWETPAQRIISLSDPDASTRPPSKRLSQPCWSASTRIKVYRHKIINHHLTPSGFRETRTSCVD